MDMRLFLFLLLDLVPTISLRLLDTTSARIAVFSAQFGGRDRVEMARVKDTIQDKPDGLDLFLFTDMQQVTRAPSSKWEFVTSQRHLELCTDNILCKMKEIPNLSHSETALQNILASKFYKMRFIAESAHLYDFILWMDGKYLLKDEKLNEKISKMLPEDIDMLVMHHPERHTMESELQPAAKRAAAILGQDPSEMYLKAKGNYQRYKSEGFSDTIGLFDSAMFIVRPNRVRDMFLDWWHEVQQGVPRDQCSMAWMMEKHHIRFKVIKNPCDILGEHCINPGKH